MHARDVLADLEVLVDGADDLETVQAILEFGLEKVIAHVQCLSMRRAGQALSWFKDRGWEPLQPFIEPSGDKAMRGAQGAQLITIEPSNNADCFFVTIIGQDAEGQWYAQGFRKPVPRSDLRALLGEMGIDVRKCLWLTSTSSVPRSSTNGWLEAG